MKENKQSKAILEMSDNEKTVFGLMSEEIGENYKRLEHNTVPTIFKKELKKIIKKLKDLELIEVVSLIKEEDQGYFGRGWVLTAYGYSLQDELEDEYI